MQIQIREMIRAVPCPRLYRDRPHPYSTDPNYLFIERSCLSFHVTAWKVITAMNDYRQFIQAYLFNTPPFLKIEV